MNRLESLLRKYGYPDYANLAEAAAEQVLTHPDRACQMVNSDDLRARSLHIGH